MDTVKSFKIIGFSSRKSSGKTMCTSILQQYGYIPLNFADGLKNMICIILNLSPDDLENKKNDHQLFFNIDYNAIDYIHTQTYIAREHIEKTLNLFQPKTIREYLQIIGTELIRKYNPNWHIESLLSKIDPSKKYCIGDVRFLNEKNAIEKLGGKCFFIIRPFKNNYYDISNHSSEIELNWTQFNDECILINDSTVNNLIIYGKTPENEKYYKKTNLFLTVNYKSAYLAGYLFLMNINKFTKNPFILENYKLWKCSNHSFPDILHTLSSEQQSYFKKIWLKGICDYIFNHKNN